jgi:hypothetical protein
LCGPKSGLDQDPGKEKRITGGSNWSLASLRGKKKEVFNPKILIFFNFKFVKFSAKTPWS